MPTKFGSLDAYTTCFRRLLVEELRASLESDYEELTRAPGALQSLSIRVRAPPGAGGCAPGSAPLGDLSAMVAHSKMASWLSFYQHWMINVAVAFVTLLW